MPCLVWLSNLVLILRYEQNYFVLLKRTHEGKKCQFSNRTPTFLKCFFLNVFVYLESVVPSVLALMFTQIALLSVANPALCPWSVSLNLESWRWSHCFNWCIFALPTFKGFGKCMTFLYIMLCFVVLLASFSTLRPFCVLCVLFMSLSFCFVVSSSFIVKLWSFASLYVLGLGGSLVVLICNPCLLL